MGKPKVKYRDDIDNSVNVTNWYDTALNKKWKKSFYSDS